MGNMFHHARCGLVMTNPYSVEVVNDCGMCPRCGAEVSELDFSDAGVTTPPVLVPGDYFYDSEGRITLIENQLELVS